MILQERVAFLIHEGFWSSCWFWLDRMVLVSEATQRVKYRFNIKGKVHDKIEFT